MPLLAFFAVLLFWSFSLVNVGTGISRISNGSKAYYLLWSKIMTENIEDSGSIPPINIDGLTPSTNKEENKSCKNEEEKILTKRKTLLLINDNISNYSKRGLYESIIVQEEPYFLRCFSADRNKDRPKHFSIERVVYIKDDFINGEHQETKYLPKNSSLEALPFECAEIDILEPISHSIPTTQELFDSILSMIQSYVDIPLIGLEYVH